MTVILIDVKKNMGINSTNAMLRISVLAIVAIGGVTLTICLAIICSGAVYLRRYVFIWLRSTL